MDQGQGPTVGRLLLGIRLRELRLRAKVSAEDAAEHITRTDSTISRMENGQTGISPRLLNKLMDLYGTTAEEREEILVLGKQSKQRGWWHTYGDVLPAGFEVHLGLEDAATTLHAYQSELIPGLLQTEDYARALLLGSGSRPEADAEIERRVAVRMDRQQLLRRDSAPAYWAIINEVALRRPVGGPEVMRAQIKRLAEWSRQRNVTIQVLPFDTVVPPAMSYGAFLILAIELGDVGPTTYVSVAHLTGTLLLDKRVQVDPYKLLFDDLRAMALSPDESASLFRKMARKSAEQDQ